MTPALSLFWAFLKIGLLGFGGGYAMLSLIFAESQSFSITVQQFADLNALDMLVPGPIAINAATYVGYLYDGVSGATAATLGVAAPSFLMVALALRLLLQHRDSPLVGGFLTGVRPVAAGLIAAAAISIASGVLITQEGGLSAVPTAIFLLTAAASIKTRINPILLTLLAGIAGALLVGS